jgi:putative membrane protein
MINFLKPAVLALFLAWLFHRPTIDKLGIHSAWQGARADAVARKAASLRCGKSKAGMIKDHSAAMDELVSIGRKQMITVPKSPDTEHELANAMLDTVAAVGLDSVYLVTQMLDHEVAIRLFEGESERGKDTACRSYAKRYLPILHHHLMMIDALRKNAR